MRDVPPELLDDAITSAVGEELRRLREARRWSRGQVVAMLPSRIGDRSLLAYEHGTRQLSLLRLAELSWALDVAASTVFSRGLQRSRLLLHRSTLAVDLRALAADERVHFKALVQWAKNMLCDCPDGIAEVEPATVKHFARFVGCSEKEMTDHLLRFTPDVEKTLETSYRS